MGVAPSGFGGAVRVRGIEVRQLRLGLRLDFGAGCAQFVDQFRPAPGNVLQQRFGDEAGNRVEITGEGVAAQPQGFQSRGMESPPAKGSTTSGGVSSGWAACANAHPAER